MARATCCVTGPTAPADLVARQAESWDPLLGWARERYGAALVVTAGIVAIDQPRDATDRLAAAVARYDAFHLAGLSPLVTLSGSLVIGLAMAEGAATEDRGWHAAELEELYHADKWGSDPIAIAARDSKRAAFRAAARFLALLQPDTRAPA